MPAFGVKELLRKMPEIVKITDNQALKPMAGGHSTSIYCKCKYNKHEGGIYQVIVKHVVEYACFDEVVIFNFHSIPGEDRNLTDTP